MLQSRAAGRKRNSPFVVFVTVWLGPRLSILEDAGRAWSWPGCSSSLFRHLQETGTGICRHCSSPCTVPHQEGQRSLQAVSWLHKEVWCESHEQEAMGEQMKGFTSVLNSDTALLSEGLAPRSRVPEEVTSYKNAQEERVIFCTSPSPGVSGGITSPAPPAAPVLSCVPPASDGEGRQLLAPCSARDCTAAEQPEALGFGVTWG